jgi:hypothetical protein
MPKLEVAPKEALAWFDAKSLQVGFDHNDVWQQEHSRAFTVAKAMQIDVLSDIRDAVQGALKEGKTFNQFRAELTPVLQNKGWWGQQEMTDPHDGRLKEVQLGSARRLHTIYRTNMRTARAAGQWDRIQRTLKTHPYLQYNLGPSEHHRTEHESWNKLVLPANDPFWQTHFAPNGWGCKCRIRQLSTAEAKRLGINTAPVIETQEWINKRTGEVHQVPKGIDPGWAYNPGANRNQPIVHFVDKLEVAQPRLSKPAVADFVKSEAFHYWYRKPEGTVPLAIMPEHHMASIGAKAPLVQLSHDTVTKQHRVHADIQEQDYRSVQAVLDKGWSILDGSSRVYVWETAGYVTVIKATVTGKAVFMTSLRRLSKAQSKRDKEIQRIRKKAGK